MKKLSKIVGKISTELFEQKGFVDFKIISNWRLIIGEDIAQICSPVKVTFQQNQKRNGTLYISVVSPAFSLRVQSKQQQILNKIYEFFGYDAISNIKIIIRNKKKKLSPVIKVHKPLLSAENSEQFEKNLKRASNDDDLSTALKRLRLAIFK